MAALITAVPAYVPSAAVFPQLYDTQQTVTGNHNFFGPFAVGGALYLVLYESITVGPVLTVYMSTNGGATWTAQDNTHQPVQTISGYSIRRVGAVLHIAMVVAGDINLITFNCTTNLWGAISTNAGVTGAIGTAITVQANGTRFVFYTHSGTSANVINLLQLTSGGAWSGPTTIATAAGGTFNRLTNALLDGSAVSHVFWEHRITNTTGCKLQTIGVDSTGALVGAVTDISAATATISTVSTGSTDIPGVNLALGANGTYAHPIPWIAGLAGVVSDPKPYVVLGDPTGGWATSTPDPLSTSIPAGCTAQGMQCLGAGGLIYAFWAVFDIAGVGTTDQIWSSTWNGTAWSIPQLVYDAVANPAPAPADTAPNQWTLTIWNAVVLPTGGIGVAISFRVTSNPPANHGTAFPVFFAFSALPASAGSSQLVFYGVRRGKIGTPGVSASSDPAPWQKGGRYYEKPYSYPYTFKISQTYNLNVNLLGQQSNREIVKVQDFDFELRQITKAVFNADGTPFTGTASPFAMTLYDAVLVARSNIPLLAELLCDDTFTTKPNGRNFWPAPPILFPINSYIAFDWFTMLNPSVVTPITVSLLFRGVRRIPCL